MKQYKSRDKITQKMTRDGLIEVNETQQTAERISKREQEADFQKSPGAAKAGAGRDAASKVYRPKLPRYPTRRELSPQGTPPPQSVLWSISETRTDPQIQ